MGIVIGAIYWQIGSNQVLSFSRSGTKERNRKKEKKKERKKEKKK